MANNLFTREVVIAFTLERLQEVGCQPCSVPELHALSGEISNSNTLRAVIALLNRTRADVVNKPDYASMVEFLSERQVTELPSNVMEANINALIDTLFVNGYTWGRILVCILYTTEISVRAMRDGNAQRVVEIINWVSLYLNREQPRAFIENNGGWVKNLYYRMSFSQEFKQDLTCCCLVLFTTTYQHDFTNARNDCKAGWRDENYDHATNKHASNQ